ncbi:TIGR03084 family metal-binding protein [Alterisphingorhabdus coralli]|uniref:TIGR03084 family metal-binding protein n=1 Tax=Alterisphingorhabdus coralli TaxID=3071408 RepID=A0AA97F963_9SPHN|nr:TIGR03084 family metal-binding protein [Parasphingorhabdus sp. SCSIO 66989]WOE75593.1 TIGR03084 family metal-binding protein [Parasphingorhabdus sp. SCSIO 66989]
MQQAEDFRTECDAIHALVAPLDTERLAQPTAFKGWSVDAILRHLHVWNVAADLSLTDEAGFQAFFAKVGAAVAKGGMSAFESDYLEGLSGPELVKAWVEFYPQLADHFAAADPKQRVAWAGPSMSARSSITARLMESWAHAQAIYDMLGQVRQDGDHIRNIVVLGVNTFGWTYKNRKLPVPETMPLLELTAPQSGDIWRYGEPGDAGRISGSATEFCQVVTQTRNIADTDLQVEGDIAREWMAMAQCFAGPPHDPPEPGVRKVAVV